MATRKTTAAAKKILSFSADAHNTELAALTGPIDANLRQIETELDVTIARRGHVFRVEGGQEAAQATIHVLEQLLMQVQATGKPLSVDDIQLFFVERRTRPDFEFGDNGEALPELHTKRRDLQGRNPRQREYIQAILDHDISFGIGPAGTGKTYLAIAKAVEALEAGRVGRIVLSRPAVEAGESIGFLPGDAEDKLAPYLRPLYDALSDRLSMKRVRALMAEGAIEIAPVGFMRGRTLNNAFVVIDEAQNCTYGQLKMLLTRLGWHSTMVVTGDPAQSDLLPELSGLGPVADRFEEISNIAVVRLKDVDIVRHPLVAEMLGVL